MITLPEALLRDVDALAEHEGQNRSQLIREALRTLLEQRRMQAFDALLAEGYQEMEAAASEVVAEAAGRQADAAAGLWRWDE